MTSLHSSARPPLRVAVIVGSDREGRFATTVARWVLDHVGAAGGFEVDLLDVVDLDLPSRHPASPDASVRSLRERLDAADAFLVITPEYNHSFPASLKHLLDLAKREWARKPMAFVSYGGISGGLRATEQLRVVAGAFDAHALGDTVSLHGASSALTQDATAVDPASDAAMRQQLASLTWWGHALRDARESAERTPAAAAA